MPTVNQPQRRTTGLENLANALTVASQGYNLYRGVKNAGQADAEADRKKQGVYTEAEANANFSPEKFEEAKDGDAGATTIKVQQGDNVIERRIKQRSAEAKPDLISAEKAAGWEMEGAKRVPVGTQGALTVPMRGADGKVEQVAFLRPPKEGKAKDPKLTDDQFKAGTFGQRAEQAEKVFAGLAEEGFDRSGVGVGIQSAGPNVLKSASLQKQEQAERNFLNAVLRKESGAVISEDEFDNGATQYFPRAGDSPEVLAQKSENRALAVASLKAQAGDTWGKIDGKKQAPSPIPQDKMMRDVPSAMAGEKQKATAEDVQALAWAQSNPKDPRAAEIMKRVRAKGL